MGKSPESSDPRIITPEAVANFEGNDSLLLIGRVSDPVIRNQIIDVLYQNEMIEEEHIRNLKLIPYSYPGKPEWKCFKDEEGVIYSSTSPDYNPKNHRARTKDEIAAILDEDITRASVQTPIDYSTDEPNEGCIPLNWRMPWSGQPPTVKQKSIIAAHEMGHAIRKYSELRQYFSRGFDYSKIDYTDKDFEMDLALQEKDDESDGLGRDGLRSNAIRYLFSGPEVAERMSQLKNYFGMKGSEQFTRDHLEYARQYYITDTGMDNRMRHFFQAITPETETAFFELNKFRYIWDSLI